MPKQRPASRHLALAAMVAMLGAQPTPVCVLACLLGVRAWTPLVVQSAPTVGHDTHFRSHAGHAAGQHGAEAATCHEASVTAPTAAATAARSAAVLPHPPIQQWALPVYVVPLERAPLESSEDLYPNDPPPPRSV